MRVAVGESAGAATVTTIVQVPSGEGGLTLAGIVPFVKVTEVAVLVISPPHCGDAGGTEMVKPVGRVSTKWAPV